MSNRRKHREHPHARCSRSCKQKAWLHALEEANDSEQAGYYEHHHHTELFKVTN